MPLPLDPAVYRWSLFAIPWIAVGGVLFALAGAVFARQRASRVAVLFCAMIALVALWLTGFGVMFLAADAAVAAVWARVALAAVCLMPAAVYEFSTTALRLTSARAAILRVFRAVAVVFAVLCLFTTWFVDSVVLWPWGYYPKAGPLLLPLLVMFLAALVALLTDGITEYRRTEDQVRRQRIRGLLLRFVVVYAALIDFLPMFGIAIRPVGYLVVLAFIAVAWRSIRRHRLAPITAAGAAGEILDTMADALFVIDSEARIRVVNGAVTRLFGYPSTDLLGRPIDTLEAFSAEETISRALRDIVLRGAIRDQERLFRHRSGQAIAVSVSISPVGQGEIQEGAVVIARDIRERKRAEDELHSFMRRLEQSNRELEDFAHVASHDLQEPLRKIQAFGDLLETKFAADLPPAARDYVERMRSAAGRMQVLINDLLTFSRVRTKAQPFVPVDLDAIAREVVRDLEVRTEQVGGTIIVGDLPVIEADALQMRQLLQNLIGNALKFHRPDVPPLVQIHAAVEGDGASARCRLSVSDNGIGFDEKYVDRIFTVFERLHGRGTYEGTGVGLAICRRIAERHGGEIVASSRPGEGSTFTVTLPLHHNEREAADA